MPHHSEKKLVPYSVEQMFALVADVEHYPQFLPWCVATRIRSREETGFTADLVAAFGAFREKYTSRVNLDPLNKVITIDYVDGPFKHLSNRWVFVPNGEGCEVGFDIEFSFKNKALEKLISGFFTQAVIKMTSSFETRAHALYGRN